MRVVADLATANIVQVEKSPSQGDARTTNGKFFIPIPEMVSIDVNPTSYVLPVDGGDVTSLAMAKMLVEFPMYQEVVFNPLLTAADVADLDLTATFTPTGDVTRAVVGRGSGPLPTGVVPNVIGILPQNNAVSPARPGVLITDTIDIGPLTSGVGADEFLVWWKLYTHDTTDDVTSDYGATSGMNDPALRTTTEELADDADLEVYISHDDGATYTQIISVTPADLGTFGSLVRLAFVNVGSRTLYLGSFAILF